MPFDPESAGLVVLAADSMVRHGHADGAYRERREDCEESARRLGVPSLRGVTVGDLPIALEQLGDRRLAMRTRHIVTENQRVLDVAKALSQDRWQRVGELLNAAHESYRDDFEASCPEVDVAVGALLDAGAIGARLTGGGFGGAAISLVPNDLVSTAVAAVESAYESRGYQPATIFTVVPSAGARRIA